MILIVRTVSCFCHQCDSLRKKILVKKIYLNMVIKLLRQLQILGESLPVLANNLSTFGLFRVVSDIILQE